MQNKIASILWMAKSSKFKKTNIVETIFYLAESHVTELHVPMDRPSSGVYWPFFSVNIIFT